MSIHSRRSTASFLRLILPVTLALSSLASDASTTRPQRNLAYTSIVPTVFNTPDTAPSTLAVTYSNFPFTHFEGFHPAETTVGNCVGGADGDSWIVRDWRINLAVAPGLGASWTFMVRKLGLGDTGFSITISGANRTGVSGSQELVVYPGDVLTVAAIPSTAKAPTPISKSGGLSMVSRWIGPGDIECTGGTGAMVLLASMTRYLAPQFGGSSTNRVDEFMPWPVAGTFISSRVNQDCDPGGIQEYDSYRMQVNPLSNGVYQGANDSDMSMRVVSGSLTDSDQVHAVHVNRGDLVGWKITASAHAASTRFRIGYVFVPDMPGESAMTGHFYLSTKPFQTWECNPGSVETQFTAPVWACQLSCLVFALTSNVEGQGVTTGKQCTQILRKNCLNTAMTLTGTGPRVYWEDSIHSASFADGDLLDFEFTGVNSAPGWVHYGIALSVPQ